MSKSKTTAQSDNLKDKAVQQQAVETEVANTHVEHIAMDTSTQQNRQSTSQNEKPVDASSVPATIVKGTSPLLWFIAFLAIFLALATGWYSYTMWQQQGITRQVERENVISRIGQLENEQRQTMSEFTRVEERARQAQAELVEKVQQNFASIQKQMQTTFAGMRSEVADIPAHLTEILLGQLITQADLLMNAEAPHEQVIPLLQEALRLAQIAEQPSYRELIAALKQDIASLAVSSASDMSQKFANIDAIRARVRSLEFSPVPETTQLSAEQLPEEGSTWSKVSQWLSNLFGQFVVVRRHQEEIRVDLSMDQFTSVKLLVESSLAQAQASLLLGEEKSYTDLLTQAASQLRKYFFHHNLEQLIGNINELADTGLPKIEQLNSLRAFSKLTQ